MSANPESPAVVSRRNGYTYVVVSRSWRERCSILPCNVFIDWVGYASDVIESDIGGQKVYIQCWKGWCPRFLGNRSPAGFTFPGGIGAEVGIYSTEREFPWQAGPGAGRDYVLADDALDAFLPIDVPSALVTFVGRFLRHLKSPDPGRWWMPDVDAVKRLKSPVSFSLYDPRYRTPVIGGYRTKSYWTCKWMQADSYDKWLTAQALRHPQTASGPVNPDEYTLEFQVDGKHFIWEGKSAIREVSRR